MGKRAVSKLVYFISIIITFIFVLITIVGAFSSYADPSEYPFMGYLGVALPVLLVINILYIIYWGIRWRRWIWLPVIAILANTGYITSMFQFSTSKQAQGETIKVATLNARNFNYELTGYTAKQIAGYMRETFVDVICFQEFNPTRDFNLDSLRNVFSYYPHIAIPHLPNGSVPIAIFSKYPVLDSSYIPFAESNNSGMWADIQAPGKSIRIFNLHMQTTNLNQGRSALSRQKGLGVEAEKKALMNLSNQMEGNLIRRTNQAKQVREIIDNSKNPIIVCGDFNDTPSSFTYRHIKGDLQDGFKTAGNGYGYTFKGMYRFLRIDYIFHSSDLKGINYQSPSFDWSDHNPVIFEIGL